MVQIIPNQWGWWWGGGGWDGDMKKSVYDPNNVSANAFDYDNFINTPTIPTDTSELTNWAWYITGIDSWDVTTALGYTPLKAGDDVSDLVNDAWYITGITSWDVTTALWFTPADSSSLWTAAACDTGTGSWDVPVLDANWKLDTSTLPWVALTDTFTVTNKADLTSLSSAQQWDIGIVTAESKTYVLSADPYSTASNWKELLTPTDTVTSVNSKTGAVVLDADDISDSTTTNKFVTATDKSEWSGKQDALTLPATPTQWNLVTWWADKKTLVDGWAIPTGVPAVWSNGQVLTVVSGVAAWAAPTGWMTVDASSPLTPSKFRFGTQAQYEALWSYSNDIVYMTI